MKRSLLAFALLALAAQAHAEPRKVGAFEAIELAGLMAVEAHVGSAISVDVQGDADLAKLVSTTVKNGTLVIDTPKGFEKQLRGRNNNKLKVIVTMPALSRVAISGTGSLEVDGVSAKSLDASIGGTGSLALTGKVEKLKLAVDGTGEVRAKKLDASDVTVSVSGTAKALLNATKSFAAEVHGTAVIKVRGNPPSVHKHVDGVAMIDVR